MHNFAKAIPYSSPFHAPAYSCGTPSALPRAKGFTVKRKEIPLAVFKQAHSARDRQTQRIPMRVTTKARVCLGVCVRASVCMCV